VTSHHQVEPYLVQTVAFFASLVPLAVALGSIFVGRELEALRRKRTTQQ